MGEEPANTAQKFDDLVEVTYGPLFATPTRERRDGKLLATQWEYVWSIRKCGFDGWNSSKGNSGTFEGKMPKNRKIIERSACFFAPVSDPGALERVKFYADDLQVLRGLFKRVHVCTRWRDLKIDVSIIFVWWWTWAFVPVMLGRLLGIPVVITGTFNFRHKNPSSVAQRDYFHRPAWQRALIRLSVLGATANIFVSENETRQVSNHFGINNGYFVPHGVDCLTYRRGHREREPFILNVAWTEKANAIRKGLPEIIEAFEIVARTNSLVRLVLAGKPGDYDLVLKAMAHELGINERVLFLGEVSERTKIDLLQTCMLYVQPSRYEGFGLALAEAMACGCPVIVSREGAIPELVATAGEYIDSINPASIAGTIAELIESEEKRDELSRLATKRIAEVFSLERRVSGIRRIILSAIGSSPTPRSKRLSLRCINRHQHFFGVVRLDGKRHRNT